MQELTKQMKGNTRAAIPNYERRGVRVCSPQVGEAAERLARHPRPGRGGAASGHRGEAGPGLCATAEETLPAPAVHDAGLCLPGAVNKE